MKKIVRELLRLVRAQERMIENMKVRITSANEVEAISKVQTFNKERLKKIHELVGLSESETKDEAE